MTPFVTTFHEKPYRHYQVHPGQADVDAALKAKKGIRVASVTQVIGTTTDKSGALTGWTQRETVNAIDALYQQYGADDGLFRDPDTLEQAVLAQGRELDARAFVDLFESQQTTLPWGHPEALLGLVKQSGESMTAKMKAAADRGLAIHNALEDYAKTGRPFNLNDHPEAYRGYLQAVASWLVEWNPTFLGSEVVVGSIKHLFGGRLDHHLVLERSDERVLIDLKTNAKGTIYPVQHFPQVEAYELAAVESGHPASVYRAVLAVGPDGNYQFRRSCVRPEQFLNALAWFKDVKQIERDAKKKAAENV